MIGGPLRDGSSSRHSRGGRCRPQVTLTSGLGQKKPRPVCRITATRAMIKRSDCRGRSGEPIQVSPRGLHLIRRNRGLSVTGAFRAHRDRYFSRQGAAGSPPRCVAMKHGTEGRRPGTDAARFRRRAPSVLDGDVALRRAHAVEDDRRAPACSRGQEDIMSPYRAAKRHDGEKPPGLAVGRTTSRAVATACPRARTRGEAKGRSRTRRREVKMRGMTAKPWPGPHEAVPLSM